MVISKVFEIFSICNNMESLNKLNIRYYIMSKSEPNSIINKTINFYNKFISELTEESNIFKYLLNIDSGEGYYNGERLYTFDMTNLEMIKLHLRELFPSVLVFFYCENRKIADTDKETGCISINEYHLKLDITTEDIDYNKTSSNFDEKPINEITTNLIITLLHEYVGHGKFSYCSGNDSPKKNSQKYK